MYYYYRIAEIILESELCLPSFSSFICSPAEADVTLTRGGEFPPEGSFLYAGAIKVSRLPDGWLFQQGPGEGLGLMASQDYTKLSLIGSDAAIEALNLQIRILLRTALECLMIRRGYVSLHAAAVEVNGKAYAFTGPSGMGKSTRAGAWQEAFGAELISGDRPLIKVDTMELFGAPWDGKEQCFRNVRYPLDKILEIRRADTAHVRELSFEQRRRLLMRQTFVPMWDTETSILQMKNMRKLAENAQILRAFGGPGPEDAKKIQDILKRQEWEKEEPDMKAKSDFTLRDVMGEYMLMPTGENIGKYEGTIVMNDVAAFVWEKLQNPVSRDDLLAAVMDEFDVEEAVAAKDLDALLEKLKNYGVIE